MYLTRHQSSAAALLLCTSLLLQNCQSQMYIAEEDSLANISSETTEQQENTSDVQEVIPPAEDTLMQPVSFSANHIAKRPFDVFISNAGADSTAIAKPLYEALRRRGVKSFWSREDLQMGERVPSNMQTAMERALCGVFILSPEFVANEWAMIELCYFLKRREEAKQHGYKLPHLLPVFYRLSYEECNNPNILFDRYSNFFENCGFNARIHKGDTNQKKVRDALQELSKCAEVRAKVEDGPSQLVQSTVDVLCGKTEELRALHASMDPDRLKAHYLRKNFTLARSLFPQESPKHVKDLSFTLQTVSTDQDTEDEGLQYKERISVEELFTNRGIQPGEELCNIQKVLIVGDPGTGKTTLSKYLAYRWATGTWGQEFQAVYVLPVRNLQARAYSNAIYRRAPTLATAVVNNCFIPPLAESAYKTLRQKIDEQLQKTSTLVVLDGLDERLGASEPIITQAETGNHKLLLLSRSYGGIERERAIVDVEVEHVGLSITQVRSYINANLPPEQGAGLLSLLGQNRPISEILHVPINLQILCFLMGDQVFRAEIKKQVRQDSLPGLYAMVMHSIWIHYVISARAMGKPIEDRTVLFDMLGKIGLKSLQEGELLISAEVVDELVASSSARHSYNILVQDTSFLLLQRLANSGQYQFPHLTFQEYFAGRWLGKQLFSYNEPNRRASEAFLAANKYVPTYARLLSFMAGEVSMRKGDWGLRRLLAIINTGVSDTKVLHHLQLQMRLLNELLCLNKSAKACENLTLIGQDFKILVGLQHQFEEGIRLAQHRRDGELLSLLVKMFEESRSVAKYASPLYVPCLLAACYQGSNRHASKICYETLILICRLSAFRCYKALETIILGARHSVEMRVVAIGVLESLAYADSTLSSRITALLKSAFSDPVPAIYQAAYAVLGAMSNSAPTASLSSTSSSMRPISSSLGFGKRAWSEYFGDVGEEPPLPPDIEETLASPCPFWLGRRVKDTHVLVLIPATVNGDRFTLDKLEALTKRYFKANKGGYYHYCNKVKQEFGSLSPSASYWVLLMRDIFLGGSGRPYAVQDALVSSHAVKIGFDYCIPNVLEASTAILMHYIHTGEYLLGGDPWTYTYCHEQLSDGYTIVVGGLGPMGLTVNGDYHDYVYGVLCCWQL